MDLARQQPSEKVEKIKKKGKDWTDDENDSCVALTIFFVKVYMLECSAQMWEILVHFLPLCQERQVYFSYSVQEYFYYIDRN